MSTIDDSFSEIRSVRNDIWRCRRLLQTELADAERDIVEKRLRERLSTFEELLQSAFPLALKLSSKLGGWMGAAMTRLPMTAAGHAALEDELRGRIRIERPRLVQRIQQAIADDANLIENSEYQAAQAEQNVNEARIAELEDKLALAEIVDVSKLSGDTIKFGATVTLIDEDTGEKRTWQIVGEPEADASKGRISVTSPMAKALIGKTKGTTVLVEAPGGAKAFKVRYVEWFEDKPKKRKQV